MWISDHSRRMAALFAGPLMLALIACNSSAETAADEKKDSAAPQAEAPKAAATGVDWRPYEQGLTEAKQQSKPVCLIFYTDWCPHCQRYKKVFENAEVVELSRKFVMIHINKDQDPKTSAQYAPDGEYIPRTFFLKSDGTLLEQVTEKRPTYKYFYDENDPASVMRSMKEVLAMNAG